MAFYMLGLLEPNGLGAEAVWEQLADRSSTQHSQLLKLNSVRASITAPSQSFATMQHHLKNA